MKPPIPSSLYDDGLKLVSYCPSCESRSNPMQARILGEDGETHLLHVTCKKCENATIALVLVDQAGASSVGLMTDLHFDDVWRFHRSGPVTIDQVIDMHHYLESAAWKGFARRRQRSRVRKRHS